MRVAAVFVQGARHVLARSVFQYDFRCLPYELTPTPLTWRDLQRYRGERCRVRDSAQRNTAYLPHAPAYSADPSVANFSMTSELAIIKHPPKNAAVTRSLLTPFSRKAAGSSSARHTYDIMPPVRPNMKPKASVDDFSLATNEASTAPNGSDMPVGKGRRGEHSHAGRAARP